MDNSKVDVKYLLLGVIDHRIIIYHRRDVAQLKTENLKKYDRM